MKNILFAFAMFMVSLPVTTHAHGSTASSTQEPGIMMMQQVEEQALGNDLHAEMEDLMTKMMMGDLSQNETDRMVELMNQYPGPGSMMMGRMMGMGALGSGMTGSQNNSMMGDGSGGFGTNVVMIIFSVLVILGFLALVTYTTRSGSRNDDKSREALNVLKQRYAKGEIDEEEFRSKKRDIEN